MVEIIHEGATHQTRLQIISAADNNTSTLEEEPPNVGIYIRLPE